MINKVILLGNVGADPEIRTLESGIKVARVRLATTERIYNRTTQETKEHTEWHTVTLWRNLADVADRYIKKGSQLYIEGNIRAREWSDESGAKRSAIEIVANDMKMLGRREGGVAPSSYEGGSSQQQASSAYSAPSSNDAQSQRATQAPAQTPAPAATAPVVMNDEPDDLPF